MWVFGLFLRLVIEFYRLYQPFFGFLISFCCFSFIFFTLSSKDIPTLLPHVVVVVVFIIVVIIIIINVATQIQFIAVKPTGGCIKANHLASLEIPTDDLTACGTVTSEIDDMTSRYTFLFMTTTIGITFQMLSERIVSGSKSLGRSFYTTTSLVSVLTTGFGEISTSVVSLTNASRSRVMEVVSWWMSILSAQFRGNSSDSSSSSSQNFDFDLLEVK